MKPDQIEKILGQAIIHHQAGRLAEAEKLYREILQAQPEHAGALHLIGVIALQTGNHTVAIEFILHSLEIDPNNWVAYNNCGNAYRGLSKWGEAEALQCYQKSLQIKPDYKEARINLDIAIKEQHHVSAGLDSTLCKKLFRVYARFGPYFQRKEIRIVNMWTYRIGHQALEPDLFLKEGILGKRPPFKGLWLVNKDQIANPHLLKYWRSHIKIVTNKRLHQALLPLTADKTLSYDSQYQYAVALNETAKYPAIQAEWGSRPPLLKLTERDQKRGTEVLSKLGLPDNSWFICVHNREVGYSPSDDPVHAYRNSSISTYIPALKMITDMGGWVIRVGDKTTTPLPNIPKVIDYAVSDYKSDWMDVFLCASCRMFLGSSSGLVIVANVFGITGGWINQTPLSATLPYGISDIAIPKLVWSEEKNRLLTFVEIFNSPIANFRFSNLYEENKLRLIDNTEDEIFEVTKEVMETINKTISYTEEDQLLQSKFKSLMKPGHYSYGAGSRVGRHFLKKHSSLLE